jgi:hypothetical protein
MPVSKLHLPKRIRILYDVFPSRGPFNAAEPSFSYRKYKLHTDWTDTPL